MQITANLMRFWPGFKSFSGLKHLKQGEIGMPSQEGLGMIGLPFYLHENIIFKKSLLSTHLFMGLWSPIAWIFQVEGEERREKTGGIGGSL